MTKVFENKNVIITGGSGGIGSAITSSFLREGAHVLVLDSGKKSPVKKLREFNKISYNVEIKGVDISNYKNLSKIKSYIKNKWKGKVDVLVNAAGIYGPIGKLESLGPKLWQKAIEVNLLGTVNMCHLVIPFMKKRGGKIINFSGGGDGPLPRFTAYSAAKGAIQRFTESLAAELFEDNIFVNAIAPGPVNTNFLDELLKAGVKKVGNKIYESAKKQKQDGGVSPGKAADLIMFLASQNAGALTGKLISAIHDDWKSFPKRLKILSKTDIYNIRRVRPSNHGYDW